MVARLSTISGMSEAGIEINNRPSGKSCLAFMP